MNPRALVVDDNPINQLVAEGHLVAAGYDVVLASSGREALTVFASQRFDIVLLDVVMPELDGFETCRQLRALTRGLETPILFLTALNDHHSHRRALEAGGDDYLTKPVQRVELLLRVRSLVRIKRLLEELRSERDALLIAREQRRRLSRMIVHDLKSPIQAILGYAELQLPHTRAQPKLERYTLQIQRAGERMHAMVLEVLANEASDGSSLLVVREQIPAAPFMREVVESLTPVAQQSGHALLLDSAEELVVEADPDLLRRTLENLIRNAIEHTPACDVHIRGYAVEGVPRFEVNDHGPGVPSEARAHIFEPHVTLSTADTANQGLGLAFCRLAVEAHAGHLWVTDHAEGGASFCFSMPSPQRASRPGLHD